MKKVLLAFVLAGTAVCAQAQVQIGPKVGINVATMDLGERENKDEEGISYLLGLNAGVAAHIRLSNAISLAPELLFSQKGYSYSSSGQRTNNKGETYTYTENETFRANYVDVPLLFRLTFGKDKSYVSWEKGFGSNIKAYLNAGPTFSYWLNGKYSGHGTQVWGGEAINYKYDLDVKFVDEYEIVETEPGVNAPAKTYVEVRHDHANRLEVGGSIGGGFTLPVAGRNLLIDARYTHAFKDIYKTMSPDQKERSRVFSLSLCYLLGKQYIQKNGYIKTAP